MRLVIRLFKVVINWNYVALWFSGRFAFAYFKRNKSQKLNNLNIKSNSKYLYFPNLMRFLTKGIFMQLFQN